VVARGYEGYIAKDEAGAYEGGPTRRWLKRSSIGTARSRTKADGTGSALHHPPRQSSAQPAPRGYR